MSWNGSDSEKVNGRGEGERRRGKNSSVRLSSSPSPKFNNAGGRGRPPLPWRGIVAGLVVVIGGGIAAWVMTRGGSGEKCEGGGRDGVRPSRIAEVAPSIATNVAEEVAEEPAAAALDFQASYPRTPGHLPLPGGNVVTFKPPAPGCTTEVYTVGGLYLCDSEGNFVKYEPPKLFDNRFENTLESLAMNRMLLLTDHTKNFSKAEIAKYLASPIEIREDDPPDIVERKTATAAMKEEIREFIKDGGTYQEYIDQLHNKIGNERSLHREATRELVQLLSEGDVEGARECKARMDEFMQEKGYMGLKLPEEWQRKLDGLPEPDDE